MVIGFILQSYSGNTINSVYSDSLRVVRLAFTVYITTHHRAKVAYLHSAIVLRVWRLALFSDRSFGFDARILSWWSLNSFIPPYPSLLKALDSRTPRCRCRVGSLWSHFMFLLSLFLLKAGFKITSCWVPYADHPHPVVCPCITGCQRDVCADRSDVAGIWLGLFFTVGDIYVDRKAAPEIKAQAQSLRFIVSNGVGLLFASTVCGQIFNNTVTEQGPQALPLHGKHFGWFRRRCRSGQRILPDILPGRYFKTQSRSPLKKAHY